MIDCGMNVAIEPIIKEIEDYIKWKDYKIINGEEDEKTNS